MQAAGRAALLVVLTAAASAFAAPLMPGVLDAPPPVVAAPVQPPPPPLTPEQISTRVDPTVVTITSEWGYSGIAGTGFVVDSGGLVLTNFHVIQAATEVTAVSMGNGLIYDASVLGYDKTRDLAVLQLDSATDLPTAPIGRSAGVAVGDAVTAIGNASGRGVLVPAPGNVVALDTTVTAQSSVDGSRNELTGMIRIDADVRPGDSGGPLVDAWGDVIGVDAAGLSDDARLTQAPEAYAIPIDEAMTVVEQIREGRSAGTVHVGPTPFLGVAVRNVSAFAGSGPSQGAAVATVEYDSPAAKAGIANGDVIVSFEGVPVRTSEDLATAMVGKRPGEIVRLEWVTQTGVRQDRRVTLETGSPTA